MVKGYVIFQGLVEFESEDHFQSLDNLHRVYDTTLKESGYEFGWEFSNDHEYDELMKCECSGQQRKVITKV